MAAQRSEDRETRPNPDPTVLTTQALLREVESLRDSSRHETSMLRELIETRLNGNDQAVALLRTTTDKFPAAIADAVRRLQELHEEKFSSISTQFIERDTRTEQTSRDNKVAVDAALQAAKEAVGEQNKSNLLANAKSEAAFTKQIDQIAIIIQTMAKGLDDKIDDIKNRLTIIEGRSNGVDAQTTKASTVVSQVIAAAIAFVVVMSAVVGVVAFVVTRH